MKESRPKSFSDGFPLCSSFCLFCASSCAVRPVAVKTTIVHALQAWGLRKCRVQALSPQRCKLPEEETILLFLIICVLCRHRELIAAQNIQKAQQTKSHTLPTRDPFVLIQLGHLGQAGCCFQHFVCAIIFAIIFQLQCFRDRRHRHLVGLASTRWAPATVAEGGCTFMVPRQSIGPSNRLTGGFWKPVVSKHLLSRVLVCKYRLHWMVFGECRPYLRHHGSSGWVLRMLFLFGPVRFGTGLSRTGSDPPLETKPAAPGAASRSWCPGTVWGCRW